MTTPKAKLAGLALIVALCAGFTLVLTAPAWAGWDEAVAAYQRGDYATALREWRPLAEQGHADAQFNLGLMYSKGKGVPQDDTLAAKWYRKAAEQGQVQAQLALAGWHARCGGNIGPLCRLRMGSPNLDYTEAAKWYRLAAEQGNAEAQRNIGVMYAEGQGVPQDYVMAHKWLNLAAAQGGTTRDTVVKSRDAVAAKMSPEQIAEAQRVAREWMAAFEKRKKK